MRSLSQVPTIWPIMTMELPNMSLSNSNIVWIGNWIFIELNKRKLCTSNGKQIKSKVFSEKKFNCSSASMHFPFHSLNRRIIIKTAKATAWQWHMEHTNECLKMHIVPAARRPLHGRMAAYATIFSHESVEWNGCLSITRALFFCFGLHFRSSIAYFWAQRCAQECTAANAASNNIHNLKELTFFVGSEFALGCETDLFCVRKCKVEMIKFRQRHWWLRYG